MRGDGTARLWKTDSTPERLGDGVKNGLTDLARELGLTVRELLADTDYFVHGSTVATNTLIERNGPKVGLLATEASGTRSTSVTDSSGTGSTSSCHVPRTSSRATSGWG